MGGRVYKEFFFFFFFNQLCDISLELLSEAFLVSKIPTYMHA